MLTKEKRSVLILGKGPRDGLENIAIITKAHYSINVTRSIKQIYLNLNYNVSNIIFVC